MTSNAPQGPGWWQASDGNWYPPEQRPGYTAPPPPAPAGPPSYQAVGQATHTPPSWSAPAAHSQNPAVGGPTLGDPAAAFKASAAAIPLAAWLLFGALGIALVSIFLPWATISFGGLSESAPLDGADKIWDLLLITGGAALVWATFTLRQAERATFIGLTVVTGILVIDVIIDWATLSSAAAQMGETDSGLDVSPAIGIILYTAAVAFLAVRIVLHWISRSQAQPRPS
jgi:hypothetical protein